MRNIHISNKYHIYEAECSPVSLSLDVDGCSTMAKYGGRREWQRWQRWQRWLWSLLLLLGLWLYAKHIYSPFKSLVSPKLHPRISVILPVYNAMPLLQETLKSVENQLFHDFELIIVDDGSTDSSAQFIDQWANQLHNLIRLQIIRLPTNRGLPAVLNIGHMAAKGQFLTWISADNIYYPEFLTALEAVLTHRQDSCLVVADHEKISESGQLITIHTLREPPTQGILVKGNPGIAAFMYRQSCWEKAGRYREDLQGVEDWEMWSRLLHTSQMPSVYLPHVLMGYRIHSNRLTERIRKQREELHNLARATIWTHINGAQGLLQEPVASLWDNTVSGAQDLLAKYATKYAQLCNDEPTSSCFHVLKSTLSACMTLPQGQKTIRSLQCAINLLIVMEYANVDRRSDSGSSSPWIFSREERTEVHKYALFIFDTLPSSDAEQISNTLIQYLKNYNVKLSTTTASSLQLMDKWVKMHMSEQNKNISRLARQAYTESNYKLVMS